VQHQLRSQAAELGEAIGIIEPIEKRLLDSLLDLDAGGHPSFHGVVSFCGSLTSAS
jgi:hypothetical protein